LTYAKKVAQVGGIAAAISIGSFALAVTPSLASSQGQADISTQQMFAVPYRSITENASGGYTLTLDNSDVFDVSTAVGSQIAAANPGIVGANPDPPSLSITPDNIVYGNCGESSLYLEPGAKRARIETGYEVIASDVGFPLSADWLVLGENLSNGNLFSHTYQPFPVELTWESSSVVVSEGAGRYEASVTTGSYVLGSLGACFSGGPSDSVTVPS
jgi:hypothetical protein